MDQSAPFLRFIVVGNLYRDFLIYANQKTGLDIPGGNLLYSAAGLALWDESVGLISFVNEDYPYEWLDSFEKKGFDIRGVQIGRSDLDQRRFIAYPQIDQANFDNPMAHFTRINQPFPKALLGYQIEENKLKNYPISSHFKINQIPEDYYDATAAHICPMERNLQIRFSSILKQGQVTTLTLCAADEYMDPMYFDLIPVILKGVTAFICTEQQAKRLFKMQTTNLYEIVEALGSYGCEFVVIEKLNQKYIVYDHLTNQIFEVPAYPVQMVDITGVTDAFCGGFLAGLRHNHQPEYAALRGSISASFALEGGHAFYALYALPVLIEARLEAISNQIIRI